MPGDDVTGLDVARIGRCALHGCLYDIGRFEFEVGFNHWPDRVVEQSEFVLFSAVKICVPMPRRMPARALCAEHEETGIGRPCRMDNAAALVAFGRSKIARRDLFARSVANVDARFVERRREFPNLYDACAQLMVRRIGSLATEICWLRRRVGAGNEDNHTDEWNRESHHFHLLMIFVQD